MATDRLIAGASILMQIVGRNRLNKKPWSVPQGLPIVADCYQWGDERTLGASRMGLPHPEQVCSQRIAGFGGESGVALVEVGRAVDRAQGNAITGGHPPDVRHGVLAKGLALFGAVEKHFNGLAPPRPDPRRQKPARHRRLGGSTQQGQVGSGGCPQWSHAVEPLQKQLVQGNLAHKVGQAELAVTQLRFSVR